MSSDDLEAARERVAEIERQMLAGRQRAIEVLRIQHPPPPRRDLYRVRSSYSAFDDGDPFKKLGAAMRYTLAAPYSSLRWIQAWGYGSLSS
jgi:hypothetical protein